MATIYDVAKRARVSTYTVSAVLNRSAYVSPELTERVQKAVRELDYTINEVARSLHTRRTRTIGMLIPDIGSPFYAKVVRGAEDRLKKDDYSLILGSTYNDPAEQARYLRLFRAKQADALLLFLAAGGEPEVKQMVDEKRPVVCVGRTPTTFAADSVSADNEKGTRMAVEHLISRGRRRIAIITGQLVLSASSERVDGWRRALKKARLPAPDCYVGEGDWTLESGQREMLRLLECEALPDAVFAANFLMMVGALRALKERGVACPGEIEVMSSDDSEWLDVFSPAISTVAQPSYAMGVEAAELALKRLRHPGRRFEKIVLAPELHIRS